MQTTAGDNSRRRAAHCRVPHRAHRRHAAVPGARCCRRHGQRQDHAAAPVHPARPRRLHEPARPATATQQDQQDQQQQEPEQLLSVAVTQPRRIAALSAATRVAEEMRCKLGSTVGYAIRFERCASAATRLSYMTDGVLLRQCMSDRTLSSYSHIVLDEAHERSLETDILFGLLRRACRARPSLKVIIMSATLDIDKFCDFFGDCPVFSVPGRMYAVDILWQRKLMFSVLKSTFVARSVDTVMHIHKTEEPGDILVFLTGQQEIETAIRTLNEANESLDYSSIRYNDRIDGIVVYPIYSSMETLEQRAIFQPAPPGIRKIVFATNIAQTSVTVPGIRYVVDCGFVKQKMYDPKTHMDALVVMPISQAAATQRAGRAGRTENGRVYRLYSREAFEEMTPATVPEIQRSSLLGTILQLKKMGISDILNFDFIDPPDPELVVAATKQLFLLSAVDEHGHLTPLGAKMADLAVSPFLARTLISAAQDFHCIEQVATIAAILSTEDVFSTPRSKRKQLEAEEARKRFHHHSGDHITLLRVYAEWEANDYSRDWCFQHYIHYRALKTAKSVRSQIMDSLKKLRIYTPHSNHSSTASSSTQSHPGRSRSTPGAVDPIPILRALCTGFYVNTAKRHPQRPFFFPYLASGGAGTTDTSTSSAQLVALHIHPQSALASDDPVHQQRLDWVIYNDVQYVNRANMRVVSRIDFSMVQVLLGRNKLMDERQLMRRASLSPVRSLSALETTGSIDSAAGPAGAAMGRRLSWVDMAAKEEADQTAATAIDGGDGDARSSRQPAASGSMASLSWYVRCWMSSITWNARRVLKMKCCGSIAARFPVRKHRACRCIIPSPRWTAQAISRGDGTAGKAGRSQRAVFATQETEKVVKSSPVVPFSPTLCPHALQGTVIPHATR
ncbi:P-loop containing nucleoside triphosphate hydrolase protein [Entophlyctis helioformis]|nr:P-loop containing nucleoside triphosphate hydrolase protein [Entophlyctis helioformis]